jgi:hypothetical protein
MMLGDFMAKEMWQIAKDWSLLSKEDLLKLNGKLDRVDFAVTAAAKSDEEKRVVGGSKGFSLLWRRISPIFKSKHSTVEVER